MISILNPYVMLIAGAALISTGVGGCVYGRHVESNARDVASLQDDKQALEDTAELSRIVGRQVAGAADKARKEKENAKATIAGLRADIRSGALGLSVRADSCKQARDSGTGIVQTTARLLPAVSESILDDYADANDAVLELNQCIDAYAAVKKSVSP